MNRANFIGGLPKTTIPEIECGQIWLVKNYDKASNFGFKVVRVENDEYHVWDFWSIDDYITQIRQSTIEIDIRTVDALEVLRGESHKYIYTELFVQDYWLFSRYTLSDFNETLVRQPLNFKVGFEGKE